MTSPGLVILLALLEVGTFTLAQDETARDVFTNFNCSQANVVTDFDIHKYAGTWYEQQRYPLFLSTNGTCANHTISLNSVNGEFGEITYMEYYRNDTVLYHGDVTTSNELEGKLDVYLNINEYIFYWKYWVAATDYDSYSVVWLCPYHNPTAVDQWHVEYAFAFTRDLHPPLQVLADVDRTIAGISGLSLTSFQPTEQIC